jgi:hypothetical protein
MITVRPVILAALLGLALTGCAELARRTATPGSAGIAASTPAAAMPAVREQLTGRFVVLIGLKAQHAPPYLGTSGTNFYCLRSFIDRRTGESVDQLYVSDSYDGTERSWDAARDAAGRPLVFIPISRDKIICDASGCSYAEEFAADIPAAELRASPQGFAADFTDRAGDRKTITLSADQIAAQLAAVDAQLKAMPSAAASAEPASPSAPAHQP